MYLDSHVDLYICSSICIYGKTTPVAALQWDAVILLGSKYKWKLNSGGGTASFYTSSGNCYYLHLAAVCLTSRWKNLGLEISSANSRNGTVQDGSVLGILLRLASGPLVAKACQIPMRGNAKCAGTSTPEEPEGVVVTLKRTANSCLFQMF